MKLGRIPWINCYPVYGAIDRGLVSVSADIVSATAADLNDLLAGGQLDVSVVSAVEYAKNASDYLVLPDLSISSEGPVMSVLLCSHRPVEQLTGAPVMLTSSSRTSVLLFELLCRQLWKVRPRMATVRAEPSDLDALAGIPHEAVVVIGDAALELSARGTYEHVVDLGEAWYEWQQVPFVFAVWAARRTAPVASVRVIHEQLLQSRAWGVEHLDVLAAEAATATSLPLTTCRAYLGELDYALGPHHLEGLQRFFDKLGREQLAPVQPLKFLSAA